jgi:hypothetical protein
MIALPTSVTDAFAAGQIRVANAISVSFASGDYHFWTGAEPLTWGGVTFQPGGSLIELGEVEQQGELQATGLEARLRAIPNSDLSPDVLAAVFDEAYSQRPATAYVLFFDAAGAFLSGFPVFGGYIDTVEAVDEPGNYELVFRLESRSRDHTRTGYRQRNSIDQQAMFAGDKGLEHVSTTNPRLKRVWGQVESAQEGKPAANNNGNGVIAR